MVYYTGDIHGESSDFARRCMNISMTSGDTVIILGDVGANYYGNERDVKFKTDVTHSNATILCVHGNHEMRPWNISTYKTKEWNGGTVWYEEEYPSLLFAKDGEIYNIEGTKHLVIGGAYSADKHRRLLRGYKWWEDEQPSEEIKRYVERQIKEKEFDVIISHTCPLKYEPIEAFIPGIDRRKVDTSTEEWLDSIEESTEYKAWYCGHWHINKRIDRMHFLYEGVESNGSFEK